MLQSSTPIPAVLRASWNARPRRGRSAPSATCTPSSYATVRRTTVERVKGRLKDEFGACQVRVRGHAKVLCHLMFGMVALAVSQLMRLLN